MAEGDAPGKFHPRKRRTGVAEPCHACQGAGGLLCPLPASYLHAEGEGNVLHASTHRRAEGVAGGRACLGEGGFPWGCCAAVPPEPRTERPEQ